MREKIWFGKKTTEHLRYKKKMKFDAKWTMTQVNGIRSWSHHTLNVVDFITNKWWNVKNGER